MTVLQITIPDKKEKEIRQLLEGMGVPVNRIEKLEPISDRIKIAVKEMNQIKKGDLNAKDFDDFLNEL